MFYPGDRKHNPVLSREYGTFTYNVLNSKLNEFASHSVYNLIMPCLKYWYWK